MIDAGYPIGLNGFGFSHGILAAIAFDLNDEMEEVIGPTTVIDQDDEIRDVAPQFAAEVIRNFQAEIMILNVGAYLRMAFGNAAELGFPIAVEDDPVDVAFLSVRFPAVGLGSVESDEAGRAAGIVG